MSLTPSDENGSAYTAIVALAKQLPGGGLRGIARAVALSTLAARYLLDPGCATLLRRPRVQFLYLHHVFPDELAAFRRLVRWLVDTHTVISHSEAVERVCSGDIDAPYVALSFDDGFRSCLDAASILEEFDIHACFFLCGDIVGEKDPARIKRFCQRLEMPLIEFLDWHDVEHLLAAGHEIGSHTMSHSRLSGCTRQELEWELGESKRLLTEHCGPIRHFSWPFGGFADFSLQAARLAFELGYNSVTSAVHGCHIGGEVLAPGDICLRRNHIMAPWPLPHVLYFLARNARRAVAGDALWPETWRSPRDTALNNG